MFARARLFECRDVNSNLVNYTWHTTSADMTLQPQLSGTPLDNASQRADLQEFGNGDIPGCYMSVAVFSCKVIHPVRLEHDPSARRRRLGNFMGSDEYMERSSIIKRGSEELRSESFLLIRGPYGHFLNGLEGTLVSGYYASHTHLILCLLPTGKTRKCERLRKSADVLLLGGTPFRHSKTTRTKLQ